MTYEEIVCALRETAIAFYQERIQDGLNSMESVANASFYVFAQDNPIIRVMDAIDDGDYVLAADILNYDMLVPVERRLNDE